MHIKRIKRILVFVALLVLVLLITGCGSDIKLGASMSDLNDSEEASATIEEYDESTEAEKYDNESADTDDGEDEQADSTEEQVDDRIVTVILNTNKDRKRIHIPDTSCAKQIHEENYQEWTCTQGELVEFARKNGYVACGRCHPDVKLGIDLPKN